MSCDIVVSPFLIGSFGLDNPRGPKTDADVQMILLFKKHLRTKNIFQRKRLSRDKNIKINVPLIFIFIFIYILRSIIIYFRFSHILHCFIDNGGKHDFSFQKACNFGEGTVDLPNVVKILYQHERMIQDAVFLLF
jgi:hypothetical protein